MHKTAMRWSGLARVAGALVHRQGDLLLAINPSVRRSCPWLQEESETHEDSLRKGGCT
jgi:hypothetical protein